jgi:Bacterial Ig domain/Repeat of unknown function (DUF5648)
MGAAETGALRFVRFRRSGRPACLWLSVRERLSAHTVFIAACLVLVLGLAAWPAPALADSALKVFLPAPSVRLGFPVLVRNTLATCNRVTVVLTRTGDSSVAIFDGPAPAYSTAGQTRVCVVDMRGRAAGTYTLTTTAYHGATELASDVRTWSKSWVDYPAVGIDENNAILRNGSPVYPVDKWLGDRVSLGWQSDAMATGYVGKAYSNQGYLSGYTAALWRSEMVAMESAHGEGFTVSGPDWRGSPAGDATQLYFNSGGSTYWDPVADLQARVRAVTDVTKNQSNFLYYDWWDEPDIFGVSGTELGLSSAATNLYDDNHPVAENLSAYLFWKSYDVDRKQYAYTPLETGGYPTADILCFDWYPASGYPRPANSSGTLQGAFDVYALACRNFLDDTKGLIPLGIYVETGKVYSEGIPTTPDQMKMTAMMGIVEMDARTIRWYEYDMRDGDGQDGGGPWLFRDTTAAANARAACTWVTSMTQNYKNVLAQPSYPVTTTGGTIDDAHSNDPRVKAIRKRYDGKDYVFAYNRDVTNSANVTFVMPDSVARVKAYDGSWLVPSGVTFADEIPASGVRVYEVESGHRTPPSVSISAPAASAVVRGRVPIAVDAEAGAGVARVEFRADGMLIENDTNAPYTATWDASGIPGPHVLSARVIDAIGNAAQADVAIIVPAEVYRFCNLKNGYYLWTASEVEKNNIVATLAKTWKLEGVAYRINTTTNTSPLWRFRNLEKGFYLYTSDANEKNWIVANLSKSYVLEGVAYDVSRTAGSPVWRFRNLKDGTYLYTADANEKNTIVATMSKTWALEGVAYLITP